MVAMLTIAVVLQTCGRVAYTRRTLESFSAVHGADVGRCVRLHVDDGSGPEAAELAALAAAHGFRTVVQHPIPRGARTTRIAGIQAAAAAGAGWVLVLENDWEWARPVPWAVLERLEADHPEVYALRLFGTHKERGGGRACFRVDLSRGRVPVTWRPIAGMPEAVERARIHYSFPPTVVRVVEALWVHGTEPIRAGYDGRGDTAPEVAASGRLDLDVARVRENCVWHIGAAPTAVAGWGRGAGRRIGPPARPPARRPVRPAAVDVAALARRYGIGPAVRRRPAARPARYSAAWQAGRAWTAAGAAACLAEAFRARGVPGSLLDLGCGLGAVVRSARARGVAAVGVDLSLAPGVPWLVPADLRAPLDLGARFDAVLCWEVAEHLPAAAAEGLCETAVRHLAPGGELWWTAATPGQGGDGHLNEQPAAYWAARFEARGLVPVPVPDLAARWRAVAPRQPWYGANLQVFRAPGVGAVFHVEPAPAGLRLAVTMRTADRSPHPNYVGGTVARLLQQGVGPGGLTICATDPAVAWLAAELGGAGVPVHCPRALSPNENGLEQIRVVDPASADWILLLEDDLAFCGDFLGSVRRWIADAARPDRHLYRLFGFRVRPPRTRGVSAYDDPSVRSLCGTQAVVLRMADAVAFLAWADANLETWGGFRGNVRIAFDKLLGSWMKATYPGEPAVMAHPMLVQHIGDVSSLHPRAIRADEYFAGRAWAYPGGAGVGVGA